MFVTQVMDSSIYSEPSVERLIRVHIIMSDNRALLCGVELLASAVMRDVDQYGHLLSHHFEQLGQFREQLRRHLINLELRVDSRPDYRSRVYIRGDAPNRLVPIIRDKAQYLEQNVVMARNRFENEEQLDEGVRNTAIQHLNGMHADITQFLNHFH